MDVSAVEAKEGEAALVVFRAVSRAPRPSRSTRGEWVRARLFWSEIAGNRSSFLEIWDADGERWGIFSPREVDAPLRWLRAETATPGEGAWLSLFLTVTRDGRHSVAYDYDHRPSWTNSDDPLAGHPGDSPADESLIVDLRRYPRRPEALPAWYPVERPAPDDPRVAAPRARADRSAPIAPPASVAAVVALPGWDVVWQAVVAHLDDVATPEVLGQLASTPAGDRVQETDDVVDAVWDAVWQELVLPLDGRGAVALWEPWARATDLDRDLELGSEVPPEARAADVGEPNAPLDLVLQDLGDVVDELVESALDARLDGVG